MRPVLLTQRVMLGAVLAIVAALCWLWTVFMARDMYGPMTGWSAWMMTPSWDAAHLGLLWGMWAAMMAAMMIPAAAPLLLLYDGAARRGGPGARSHHGSLAAAGYLLVWVTFSAAATALQRLFAGLALVSPMMEPSRPLFGAAVLFVAGVYQLTPLKRVCLTACRSPLAFLSTRRSSGAWGALRVGVDHGAYCLGCCWALMLLLFAGGVMNLFVIAALTLWVLVEKLAPLGDRSVTVSGVLLIATSAWMALGA